MNSKLFEEREVDCPWCGSIVEPLYYVSEDKIVCTCPSCNGAWEEEKDFEEEE